MHAWIGTIQSFYCKIIETIERTRHACSCGLPCIQTIISSQLRVSHMALDCTFGFKWNGLQGCDLSLPYPLKMYFWVECGFMSMAMFHLSIFVLYRKALISIMILSNCWSFRLVTCLLHQPFSPSYNWHSFYLSLSNVNPLLHPTFYTSAKSSNIAHSSFRLAAFCLPCYLIFY